MMKNPDIKRAIDTTLSGIDCSARDIRQVLDHAKGEPEMKRKVSISLVVVLIAILLAATALAVGLNRSAKDEAMKVAREALIQTYGHTYDTIGIFDEEATASGGSWTIEFTPTYFNLDAIGTYRVTVRGGSVTDIRWSHDDDAGDYHGANLDAPVWGPEQIELALDVGNTYGAELYERLKQMTTEEKRALTLEEWAALDAALLQEGQISIMMNVAPNEDDIQEAQAIELALTSLQESYGLAREVLEAYDISVRLFDNVEYRYYMISGRSADGATFDVKFETPSGDMMSCAWTSNKDEWALPEGPLDGYEKAVKQYTSGEAFRLLPAAEKAEVSQRIHAAGYGSYIDDYHYVAPEADDITEDAAIAAALDALHEKFGITEAMLELFDRTTGIVQNGDRRDWRIFYTPIDPHYWATDFETKFGKYEVLLDAKDGTPDTVSWTLEDVAPDAHYTRDNWGTAPAWGSEVLSYILEFDAAQKALEAKYAHTLNTLWTLEDYAARDQLFRDAGFVPDEWHYRFGLPGEGDLTEDEAMQIAYDVMKADYGLTDERLETMIVVKYFFVHIPDAPYWQIDLFTTGQSIQSGYSIRIDATTGTILETEYTTGGNG